MLTPSCPSCGHEIQLDHLPEMGARVVCPACRAELEIIWLFPLELERSEEALPQQEP